MFGGTFVRERINGRKPLVLKCVIPVVCRNTNGEVNISHENTIVLVWIYGGV